nr:sensor histidine kinase [Desulfobacterales bacterium]
MGADSYLRILSFFPLPLILFILGRGLRSDRIFFSLYLICVSVSTYLWSLRIEDVVPWSLALGISAVISFNFLFYSLLKDLKKTFYYFSHSCLIIIGLCLVLSFLLDYRPEFVSRGFYFPSLFLPRLTMAFLILYAGLFMLHCEIWRRNVNLGQLQRIFFGAVKFWWLILSCFLIKTILSQDPFPFWPFDVLFSYHILLLLSVYFLIFRTDFLSVRLHPSPDFAVRFTSTIFLLGAFTCFLWGEVLKWEWDEGIGHYWDILLISAMTLIGFLFVIPLSPFKEIRDKLFHHLYMPEQDFALEVRFYLEVLGQRGRGGRVLDHLREKLAVSGAAIYAGKHGRLDAFAFSPERLSLPESLARVPKKGEALNGLLCLEALPIKREESESYLLLLAQKARAFSRDEKSLIRFWSLTLGMLMDEMERQRRQQQEERMAIFSQAMSFIIHDAKNMAQLLDLLVKNAAFVEGEGEAREFLRELRPAMEKARSRAKKILKRIETFNPQDQPTFRDVDVSRLLDEVSYGVRERVQVKSSPLKLRTDPDLFKRIIENLLLNALQASTGEVEMRLEGSGVAAFVAVCDRGPGVPEELREKIFEPFFTTRAGGTGLGLYEARLLIKKLGGDVWYEPREGGGSCFWCRFPKGGPDSRG